jgi:hypothetical protein
MFEQMNSELWVTRHSKSGKDVESAPGLSKEGVELAKERAKTLAQLISDSEEGSVILFGGVSLTPRTRSTMEIYSQEAADIVSTTGVQTIDKEALREDTSSQGFLKTAESISQAIKESPQQKFAIELPLVLKELSMESYLYESDGVTVIPEWQALLDKHGKDYSGLMKEWLETPSIRAAVDPLQIAEQTLSGMNRLASFTHRFAANRPLKIAFVGHSLLLDTLLIYLANNGEVTPEGFEKIQSQIISEAELSTIKPTEDGHLSLNYHDQEFVF